MVKGILLSLILIACAGAGRVLSKSRKRRADTLNDVTAAIRVLRLRMLNSMEPIGILLRKSDLALFQDLGNNLWEACNLSESWANRRKEYVKRGGPLDSLLPEDMQLMDLLFQSLGGSGKDEQNNLFATVISRLEEQQANAQKKFYETAKMYTALGALIGVGICILIV